MYMNFLRHLYIYQNKLQAILTILCWLKKLQLLISWKNSEKICDVLFSGSGDLLNRNSYGIMLYIILKPRIWAFRICFLFYNSFIRTGDICVWSWSSRFDDNCLCSFSVKVMWFWRKGQWTWTLNFSHTNSQLLEHCAVGIWWRSMHYIYVLKNDILKFAIFQKCLTLNLTLNQQSKVKYDNIFWKPICELYRVPHTF